MAKHVVPRFLLREVSTASRVAISLGPLDHLLRDFNEERVSHNRDEMEQVFTKTGCTNVLSLSLSFSLSLFLSLSLSLSIYIYIYRRIETTYIEILYIETTRTYSY